MAPKPMTAGDVSRLLGRVAFGATPTDLDTWTGKPYADLVDSLLAVGDLPVVPPQPDDALRVALASNPSVDSTYVARQWWLERMRTGLFPLVERMTLLWHGHFATGVRFPPSTAQVLKQNETLRTHALGDFRELLAAVTVDDAMLLWLNGNENATPYPNENYAREFFELFALGKQPQVYTERDVREAARAFTGWIVSAAGPQFVPQRHDTKPKRILGRTVNNAGENEYRVLVDLALAQPVASRFIAWKLVANLAYLPGTNDPLVRKVAATLAKGWSVKDALRTLMLADEFRYGTGARQLVRTPVEAYVHASKSLNVRWSDNQIVVQLERMGHSLFDPADVSGWPLGREWVTATTALARYDAAVLLYDKAGQLGPGTVRDLPAPADMAGWARLLGVPAFSKNTANAVGAYVRRAGKGTPAHQVDAGILALLLSSPEWVVF